MKSFLVHSSVKAKKKKSIDEDEEAVGKLKNYRI